MTLICYCFAMFPIRLTTIILGHQQNFYGRLFTESHINPEIVSLVSGPCKITLTRIRDILQNVNKELATEKRTLSSWKISMSQSFSQLENNLPGGEIKERARRLMIHQKRLLSAFQRQKVIAGKLSTKNLQTESQVDRYYFLLRWFAKTHYPIKKYGSCTKILKLLILILLVVLEC